MATPDLHADEPSGDKWSRWLLCERDAGDPALRERNLAANAKVRDRVLDAARLAAGDVFLDVGAGEGLMGLGAIARGGPSVRVIFSDVSLPLLNRLRERVAASGLAGQCSFVHASAERMAGVDSDSVDVVAARAAFAYAPDKAAAFAECYRVLRPGGRLSIAEPINQDHAFGLAAQIDFLRANPGHPQATTMRLTQRIKAACYPTTLEAIAANPLTNYSERDLVGLLRGAGFAGIHVELHIDVRPLLVSTWQGYLNSAPYPGAPTPAQVIAAQFTPEEASFYESQFRPIVESGRSLSTEMIAYAAAEKPMDRQRRP